MILVNGCSFTSGEESPIAWPSLIPDSVNVAESGASNDYILRSTVDYVERHPVSQVIVAWTTPNRIELGGKHLTPTSSRKYGEICDQVFAEWDEPWAIQKFHAQVALLHGYLSSKNIPGIFIRTFDVPDSSIGDWMPGSIVEWMGRCPKGPGGHPLQLGHERIAKHVKKHIRNLGWLP